MIITVTWRCLLHSSERGLNGDSNPDLCDAVLHQMSNQSFGMSHNAPPKGGALLSFRESVAWHPEDGCEGDYNWELVAMLVDYKPVDDGYRFIYIRIYDPCGPARAFVAKLLRKSPYEGRTRWREQGRKKPSGPARIAYGPHTGILWIARTRCELKQLCCYGNPDFSVKMSDVSEYSDSEFYYPKENKNKKKGKALWSYGKMLIDWVRPSHSVNKCTIFMPYHNFYS